MGNMTGNRRNNNLRSLIKQAVVFLICVVFIMGVMISLTSLTIENLVTEFQYHALTVADVPGLILTSEDFSSFENLTGMRQNISSLLFHTDFSSLESMLGSQLALMDGYEPKVEQALAELNQEADDEEMERMLEKDHLAEGRPAIVESAPEPEEDQAAQSVDGAGKVAIYHTHTTESFVPTTGKAFVEDLDKTVVQLGRELTQELAQYNIDTVHTEEIHDLPTRQDSYVRSLPTIRGLLEQHRDVEVVLDIHRDGVARNLTTATVNGEKVGKILLLVGSGQNHGEWRNNYQFALKLQKELENIDPNLTRGIRTRQFSYNQEVHPRALLIEIGGHENSLTEASRTVPYLAKALKRAAFQ